MPYGRLVQALLKQISSSFISFRGDRACIICCDRHQAVSTSCGSGTPCWFVLQILLDRAHAMWILEMRIKLSDIHAYLHSRSRHILWLTRCWDLRFHVDLYCKSYCSVIYAPMWHVKIQTLLQIFGLTWWIWHSLIICIENHTVDLHSRSRHIFNCSTFSWG